MFKNIYKKWHIYIRIFNTRYANSVTMINQNTNENRLYLIVIIVTMHLRATSLSSAKYQNIFSVDI